MKKIRVQRATHWLSQLNFLWELFQNIGKYKIGINLMKCLRFCKRRLSQLVRRLNKPELEFPFQIFRLFWRIKEKSFASDLDGCVSWIIKYLDDDPIGRPWKPTCSSNWNLIHLQQQWNHQNTNLINVINSKTKP